MPDWDAVIRFLVLGALCLSLAACAAGNEPAATTATGSTATATTSTTSAGSDSVVVYFLQDGKVAPVRVEIEATRAVATAAVEALLAGPPEGYETALPAGGRLESLTIDAGVATATLSDQLRSLDAAAEAQLVYTLTQFSTVTGVRTLPQPLNDEDGAPLGEPATRADFEQETPAILIETPLPHASVTSPVRVAGTANTFEATFQIELRREGEPLVHRTVTATSGTGTRGTFEIELPFDATGDATIVAWEDNAGAGPEGPPVLHQVEVPVVLF